MFVSLDRAFVYSSGAIAIAISRDLHTVNLHKVLPLTQHLTYEEGKHDRMLFSFFCTSACTVELASCFVSASPTLMLA